MTKKTTTKRLYNKTGDHRGKSLHISIHKYPTVRERLQQYIAAQRIPVTASDVAGVALQEFLAREGF